MEVLHVWFWDALRWRRHIHKDKHVLCMLDAMGRSGLQWGVSGRQGLIRIARRGDAESYGVAVMEVLRPKRDKRRRGSGGDPLEVCQNGDFRNDEVACQKDAKGC